jgi:hypothetical protein
VERYFAVRGQIIGRELLVRKFHERRQIVGKEFAKKWKIVGT